jgi:hypothetical protein
LIIRDSLNILRSPPLQSSHRDIKQTMQRKVTTRKAAKVIACNVLEESP